MRHSDIVFIQFCSGQLVPVMPAVVAYQQYAPPQHQELRSPTTGTQLITVIRTSVKP